MYHRSVSSEYMSDQEPLGDIIAPVEEEPGPIGAKRTLLFERRTGLFKPIVFHVKPWPYTPWASSELGEVLEPGEARRHPLVKELLTQRVLFYGDSNTWGAIPSVATPGLRYPAQETWPYILDDRLPSDVDVVVEGLGGRTTDFDPNSEDPLRYSGAEMLPAILATHRPVDVLVIMLGTNDLLAAHNRPIEDIAAGVEHLVDLARNVRPAGTNDPAPRILLVAPTAIDETITQTPFASYFEGGIEKSRQFGAAYAAVAAKLDVEFLDAGMLVQTDTEDGIHFSPEDHRTFATAIEPLLLELLAADGE